MSFQISSTEKAMYLKAALLDKIYASQRKRGPWLSTNFDWEIEIFSGYKLSLVTSDEIEKAFMELEYEGLVDGIHDPHAKSRWTINGSGYDFVREEREKPDSVFYKISRLGDPWLSEVFEEINGSESAGFDQNEIKGVKEDIWEPLPIERTSPEYKKAVNGLEEAVEKIEADNGYAATNPEERNTIVWSLKEGLKAIKELTPSLQQIRYMILVPLDKAIEVFKKSVTGLAVLAAKEFVKEWIKSLFN